MPNRIKRIKSFFVENWILKTVALVLAVVTFYAIRSIINEVQEFQVPIVIDVGEKKIAVLAQDANMASVTFRGSHEDLRRLDVNQIKVVVSPGMWHLTGRQQVPIGAGNVEGWLRGVRVIKVVPDILAVTFEKEEGKQVAVAKPELVGKPRIGTASIDFEPRSVRIHGPQSKLADIKIVHTDAINVDGVVDSFRTKVRILSKGETWIRRVEPSEITAKVSIVSKIISIECTNKTVLALGLSGERRKVVFEPPEVNITLHGGMEVISNIDERAVRAFVDCRPLNDGKKVQQLTVMVHLPQGINADTSVKPQIVTASLKPRIASAPIKSQVVTAPLKAK